MGKGAFTKAVREKPGFMAARRALSERTRATARRTEEEA
jgi:hypothetical protein